MNILRPQFKVDGGVHPAYNKHLTRNKAIENVPLPSALLVSMSQHLGAPASPTVKKGDTVLRGQVIGESAGFISANVHSPTSGTVKAVTDAQTAAGSMAPAIEIEPDGEDKWIPSIDDAADARAKLVADFTEEPAAKKKDILDAIADAGIAGMGGAGFPTHVKLSPPPDKTIDTLIINGAECEPYLTADNRLMIEHADQIWAGTEIISKVLGVKTIRIAIEDNKPEAIEAMQKAISGADTDVAVVSLPTEYPQGAEKQQIYAITGKEIPSGGLPMAVGAVVENVGTTVALWDAVVNGRPLIERITTVTGTPVSNPSNLRTRIGTPYSALVDFCGGTNGDVAKVISGGTMMGFAQCSLDITTTKTTSGILLLPPESVREYQSMPCISCGRCVAGCPMYLLPADLSQCLEAEDYEEAEANDVMDCIECGCCAFQCPAHRPLVQHMRRGKAVITLKRREEQAKQKVEAEE